MTREEEIAWEHLVSLSKSHDEGLWLGTAYKQAILAADSIITQIITDELTNMNSKNMLKGKP